MRAALAGLVGLVVMKIAMDKYPYASCAPAPAAPPAPLPLIPAETLQPKPAPPPLNSLKFAEPQQVQQDGLMPKGTECPATAGWLTVVEQLGRTPSFPVRCRVDLATFAEQLFSQTVPPTTTTNRGLITRASTAAQPPVASTMLVDETWWSKEMGQTFDATAEPPPLLGGELFDWLHVGGSLQKAEDLGPALDRWYAALKPGGLMSGSNFLEAGDPRNPLVNTGGFTAAKEILFLHAHESTYVARLDGSGHAVRSTVKTFALKHSLHLFVTYMYDCHDEPTWYLVKPNPRPLSPSQPVARHIIGAGPAQCKNYEADVGGGALVRDCAFAEQLKSAAARIASADSFPIRCRDDLPLLANDLGLLGRAAEVGVWAGAYAAKNLRAWKGGKYFMVDRWAPQSGDLAGCKAGSAACRDKNFPPERMTEAMETARNITAEFGDRRELVKGISTEVAPRFEDNSLDWIYIDALHTGEALIQDLESWYPKVKSGGLISGDDFADLCDPRRILDNKVIQLQGFEKVGYKSRPVRGGYGVRWGVKEFFASRGVPFYVTYMNDCYAEAAWYAIKP